MKNVLAAQHRGLLEDFAGSRVLLAFDYDGTLAPIASRPERARMRAGTRRLLWRVARCYPCIVISGRAQRDLLRRLEGLPFWQVFGNHGLEPWDRSDDVARQVREWMKTLHGLPARCPGLVVEDKRYSVAVHYRHVADKAGARREIGEAVRALRHARILGGQEAVNLLVEGAPDKGVILQRVRRALHCQTAIYIGDDPTDEEAFGSAPPDELMSIRVGLARTSRARYGIGTQRDIDRLLRTLLALRSDVPVTGGVAKAI